MANDYAVLEESPEFRLRMTPCGKNVALLFTKEQYTTVILLSKK